LKEELIRIWQLTTAYIIIPFVIITVVERTNKLHESLKQFNLRPALYILWQKEAIINTCHIAKTFKAEQ
jgi:hypothetical protein